MYLDENRRSLSRSYFLEETRLARKARIDMIPIIRSEIDVTGKAFVKGFVERLDRRSHICFGIR